MSLVAQALALALQAEAQSLYTQLDLATAFPWPPVLIGSALSGLMVDRDLDIMFDAPNATAPTILKGLTTVATRVHLLTADFRDERSDRRPTPALTDERFYAVLHTPTWKIDLTFWLHVVDHPHVADALRLKAATKEQRLRILQLKAEHRDRNSSQIYAAVLDGGVPPASST
ncbi:hypothetical protein EV645_2489 [Kribbella rubisoli]|uniref:GrpB family protein n=1 Tax=Kribbella rubisoli TaxID=3075929 RepID=A0A4Q7XCH0_9ACTN|nr:hypothetical protein [Kribbella rubisoli]RZU20259.1 hypothetical protein EV645_2489 [Kribbella rubisoli]